MIAGAGSGKTRALSHRFAYLVTEIGILPSAILCVTFTNKAAAEMRKRIRSLIGDSDTGYISTFHSFCVSVLQEDISAVGYPKSFLVLDNADIDAMLKIIYEERGLTLRDMTFSRARDMIEIRKVFKDPDYYELMISLTAEELYQKSQWAEAADDIIFWGYLYQEKKCFGLDYNDLIKFVLHIFDIDDGIRLKWQQRLEYIMIDEFQDIDELQYRLMKVLAGYHKNLFIVGDPDQTIYSWRGASVRYLLDFDKDFENVKTILMTRNYRSTPQIIEAANSLIAKNAQRIIKDLVPTLPDGARVVYHHAGTRRRKPGGSPAKSKRSGNGASLCTTSRFSTGRIISPDHRGGLPPGGAALRHFQRRGLLFPHGDQRRPQLPAPGGLPGRSVVSPRGKRPKEKPRPAPHEISAGVRG